MHSAFATSLCVLVKLNMRAMIGIHTIITSPAMFTVQLKKRLLRCQHRHSTTDTQKDNVQPSIQPRLSERNDDMMIELLKVSKSIDEVNVRLKYLDAVVSKLTTQTYDKFQNHLARCMDVLIILAAIAVLVLLYDRVVRK